jgi:hypothetical protein
MSMRFNIPDGEADPDAVVAALREEGPFADVSWHTHSGIGVLVDVVCDDALNDRASEIVRRLSPGAVGRVIFT